MRPLARVDYGWPDDDEEDDEEPTGLGLLADIAETDLE